MYSLEDEVFDLVRLAGGALLSDNGTLCVCLVKHLNRLLLVVVSGVQLINHVDLIFL